MGPYLTTIKEDTDKVCADCEGEIDYTEEAFLVQVAQAQKIGGVVLFFPVIDENNVDGNFLFEPYIYCVTCLEEHWENLKDEAHDSPPVPDNHSVIECTCCGSGIREWEYVGTFTLGELRKSSRAPNNVPGPTFTAIGKPEVVCLYCLRTFNENYVEMWPDLSQFNECIDCTHIRCWRHQNPGCECSCHNEPTKEIQQS